MPSEPSTGLLQLITAAVTPVVMISTAATLILGINSKHQSMSDRLRILAAEFRQAETSDARRGVIRQQMRWFERRVHYSALAHRTLYLAIVVFLLTILTVVLAPAGAVWTPAAYVLFVGGTVLILTAVVFEFIELWWTNRTLQLEMSDVIAPTQG